MCLRSIGRTKSMGTYEHQLPEAGGAADGGGLVGGAGCLEVRQIYDDRGGADSRLVGGGGEGEGGGGVDVAAGVCGDCERGWKSGGGAKRDRGTKEMGRQRFEWLLEDRGAKWARWRCGDVARDGAVYAGGWNDERPRTLASL